jgi:hypothetical protein
MKRKPTIPPKAKAEIADVLGRQGRISNDELDAILHKHRVRSNPRDLQRSYRLRVGQRLLASVRDETGSREILAHRDFNTGEVVYVPIDLCNDGDVLEAIQNRLHKTISSLQISSGKVANRTKRLQWLKRPFERMGQRR